MLQEIELTFKDRTNMVIRPWRPEITAYCDNIAFVCWYIARVFGITSVYDTDMFSWNLWSLCYDTRNIRYCGPVLNLKDKYLINNDILIFSKYEDFTTMDYDGYFAGIYWDKDNLLNFQNTYEHDSYNSYVMRYCAEYRYITVIRFKDVMDQDPIVKSRSKQQREYSE